MSPRLHIAGDLAGLVVATLLIAGPAGVVFPPAAVAARLLLGGYAADVWSWVALPLCTAAATSAALMAGLGQGVASLDTGLLWPAGLAMLAAVQLASAR